MLRLAEIGLSSFQVLDVEAVFARTTRLPTPRVQRDLQLTGNDFPMVNIRTSIDSEQWTILTLAGQNARAGFD